MKTVLIDVECPCECLLQKLDYLLSHGNWLMLTSTEMQAVYLGSTWGFCSHQAATHGCIRRGIFQEENTHLIWHFQIELEAASFPGLVPFPSHQTFPPTHQIITAFFIIKHRQMDSCVTICNPIEKNCVFFFFPAPESILPQSHLFLNSQTSFA